MLEYSSIEQYFDNLKCVINPQNADFDYLPFYYYQMLIARQRIYHINYNIAERLNNILIVGVYTKLM